MPPRNVVPKPLQRPHPPLWVACSRRETIQFAARNGIGALSFSFVEPEDAGQLGRGVLRDHRLRRVRAGRLRREPERRGRAADDARTTTRRPRSSAASTAPTSSATRSPTTTAWASTSPGRTVVWDEFLANRDERGFARSLVTADAAPLAVKIMQHGLGSLRGAIGTPEQVLDLCRRYEAVGVDQVIFVLQAGPNRHEHICESLELFAQQVIPAFADGREQRDAGQGGAARGRDRARAGAARARPRGPAGLRDRRAGRARARGPCAARRRPAQAAGRPGRGGAGTR